MQKSKVRFNKGDIVSLTFNPFKSYLRVVKKGSPFECFINVKVDSKDTLYPCVRLAFSNDEVELVKE